MVENSKIAILTTVANFELYRRTSQYFPIGIQKYVIDGTNGMHGIHSIIFMMEVLKNKGIEWLIMADEDVIFKESPVVFSIIKEMIENNLDIAGIRDGGMIKHRNYNPFVINTFFSILNFKEIERIWNVQDMKKNQFILDNEFDDNLSKLSGKYDASSTYEPYYCFYLWLRRSQKKILFLETNMCEDEITNKVLFKDKHFLYHTWYARSYCKSEKHTNRIDVILNEYITDSEKNIVEYILYKDSMFYINSKFKKILKKIKIKFNRVKFV